MEQVDFPSHEPKEQISYNSTADFKLLAEKVSIAFLATFYKMFCSSALPIYIFIPSTWWDIIWKQTLTNFPLPVLM